MDASMTAASQSRMAELYAAHADRAGRLAYFLIGNRHTAEDIVQDAFVRAFGRFRDLRNPSAFGPYLLRTIVNLTKKHHRRKSIERSVLQRTITWRGETTTAGPESSVDDEMFHALQGLPQRQRAALVLRYYGDLSESQAAEALDCSVGALNSLVNHGLKKLRQQMTGGGA